MKKLADITTLKIYQTLKNKGFKPVKLTFQGLAYIKGCEYNITDENNVIQSTILIKPFIFASGRKVYDIVHRYALNKSLSVYGIEPKNLKKEVENLLTKI